MNPKLDLYDNIGEIRDTLDTLLKRGKPVSVSDLQQLITAVESKSYPPFDAAAVVQQLAPHLLAEFPTPAGVRQAGQQASAELTAALARSVQEGTAQLAQAAQALERTAAAIPQEVSVRGEILGFTSVLAFLVFSGLLVSLFGFGAYAFRRGSDQEEALRAVQQEQTHLRETIKFYEEGRAKLLQTHPRLGYQYFPLPSDPKPMAAKKGQR